MKTILALLALTALAHVPASAATLKFDVSTANGQRYSFLLPEKPVPDNFLEIQDNSGAFEILNVNAIDSEAKSVVLNLGFGFTCCFNLRISPASNDNVNLVRFFDLNNNRLFSGPFNSPTFSPGTFEFVRLSSAQDAGTVRISAGPEPEAWAMLIGGFGLAGGALRYRRRISNKLAAD